jgi:hypothetical protein
MTHTTEFIMVVSDSEDYLTGYHIFSEKVNRKLRVGYELHGPPVSVERVMCQAMTRPQELNGDGVFANARTGDTTYFQRKPDAGVSHLS